MGSTYIPTYPIVGQGPDYIGLGPIDLGLQLRL